MKEFILFIEKSSRVSFNFIIFMFIFIMSYLFLFAAFQEEFKTKILRNEFFYITGSINVSSAASTCKTTKLINSFLKIIYESKYES